MKCPVIFCGDEIAKLERHMVPKHGFSTCEFYLACDLLNNEEPKPRYLACPGCSFVSQRVDKHLLTCKYYKNETDFDLKKNHEKRLELAEEAKEVSIS